MTRKRSRRRFTHHEILRVKHFYPDLPTADIARVLGCSLHSVYNLAQRFGLKKSKRYFALPASGRTTGRQGIGTRFPKGHVPFNKGQKGWQAGGRSRETQFKKGRKPQTWVPVGTEVIRDGYLTRKISDNGNPSRKDWKQVHVILWESHHGPVPDNHVVVFKNGDKADIRIENLELISRADNMRRNTLHRYPKDVARLIQLRGALNRQINKRCGNEKQNRRSA